MSLLYCLILIMVPRSTIGTQTHQSKNKENTSNEIFSMTRSVFLINFDFGLLLGNFFHPNPDLLKIACQDIYSIPLTYFMLDVGPVSNKQILKVVINTYLEKAKRR